MTTGEVEAGRETDALVAERVMGWRSGAVRSIREGLVESPEYSTEISAAWEIVERMIEGGWLWQLDITSDGYWRAVIDHPNGQVDTWHAKTAPLAICRAALQAVAATSARI